ncbi:MAG: family 10 glycosylhydrolase [Armatimonadetes bacterium]|nr:family 10 glycosylhydrolase [Armatimonadota bacterium]
MTSYSLLAVPGILILVLLGCVAAGAAEQTGSVKYLTDLTRCRPARALSQGPQEGHWQMIPYQTVDDANVKSGTMIGAPSYLDVPEVTLPLGVSGWYAIYVGYWNPHHDYDGGTAIKVRLSDDPCFLRMKEGPPGFAPFDSPAGNWQLDRFQCYSNLTEAFIKNADLTNRDLVFGKVNGPFGQKVYLAYVKLVPLSVDEVAALQARRSDPNTKTRVGSIDGLSFFWSDECQVKEHLLELVEPFRHSDFGKVIWAVNYGEVTNYPTKVARLWGTGDDSSLRQPTSDYIKGQQVAAACLRSLRKKGVVAQEVVAPYLHDMGLKFDIMFRLGIASFEGLPPRRPAHPKGFLASHPEFRVAMPDGTLVEKASYAYPQVREFMVSLVEEAAGRFDVEGVNLCFVRGPEFTGYEKPVLEEFRRRYGEDATKVGLDDPRLRTVRSSFITDFVRDVRRVLDKTGSNKGKRIALSTWVYGSVDENLSYGFDVVTWINEGYLDSVIGTGDPTIAAAAAAKECRIVSASWDIDMHTMGTRPGVSAEVRERTQPVAIKLKTVSGVNIGYTNASRSALWEAAYSGG